MPTLPTRQRSPCRDRDRPARPALGTARQSPAPSATRYHREAAPRADTSASSSNARARAAFLATTSVRGGGARRRRCRRRRRRPARPAQVDAAERRVQVARLKMLAIWIATPACGLPALQRPRLWIRRRVVAGASGRRCPPPGSRTRAARRRLRCGDRPPLSARMPASMSSKGWRPRLGCRCSVERSAASAADRAGHRRRRECGLETVELTRDLIARPARVRDLVGDGYPRRQDVACEVKRRIVLEHELGDGAILVRGTVVLPSRQRDCTERRPAPP